MLLRKAYVHILEVLDTQCARYLAADVLGLTTCYWCATQAGSPVKTKKRFSFSKLVPSRKSSQIEQPAASQDVPAASPSPQLTESWQGSSGAAGFGNTLATPRHLQPTVDFSDDDDDDYDDDNPFGR